MNYTLRTMSVTAERLQGDSVKYTRKNDNVRPFEAGGDTGLQHFAQKTDSSLFALASHSKKRPHNITLGRFFEHQMHDVLELGVERYRGIKEFAKAATAVQLGNKVCSWHSYKQRLYSALVVNASCKHAVILLLLTFWVLSPDCLSMLAK